MRNAILLLLAFSLFGCATNPRKRFLYGVGIGAGVGAIGGRALSPNNESRNINALVFGLTGAVAGGILGLFSRDDSELPKANDSLEKREVTGSKEFVVTPSDENLPSYVKDRLQPVVIEEYLEKDTVSEDGGLREPHKVWRIKRAAELSPRPLANDLETKK